MRKGASECKHVVNDLRFTSVASHLRGHYFCVKISKRQECIPGGTNITLSSDSFLVALFSFYYYTVVNSYIPAAPTAQ